MRFLNLIASLNPEHGGPIEGALKLADAQRARGHDVSFVTLDWPEADYLPKSGVTALGKLGHPGQGGRALQFHERFSFSPRLVTWLRKHVSQFDAVFVNGLWNFTTVAARLALVGQKVPYFVFPHGSLDPWFARRYPGRHFAKTLLWPLVEGQVMNHAAGVFFTTGEEQRLAHGCYTPYRVRPFVVGYGADDPGADLEGQKQAFRRTFPMLADRRFLLFLSRLHHKKGCDILIQAFAAIAAAHPDLDLVMAGPDQIGWQAALEAQAAGLGIAHRIHWTGMISGAVKWGAFRCAEAFILSSHSENFGIVVAEALACGTPVLISDKVNVWREVEEDGAGLVSHDTVDGTAGMLSAWLALPPEARAAMRERARACYERRYQMASVAGRIDEIIRETSAS
ncbi:MAG: glycosyltransferase [Novosphingobium sp.]